MINSGFVFCIRGEKIQYYQEDSFFIQQLIGTINNFTKQKEKNENLSYRDNFDPPLTGFPNRMLLTDRLTQEIKRSEREENSLTLFLEKMSISASIGIALFPQDGNESNTSIKNADRAMYQAKKSIVFTLIAAKKLL